MAFVSMLATCCTGHRDQGTVTVTAIDRSLPTQVRMYPSASITPTPTWALVQQTAVLSDTAKGAVDAGTAQAARVAAARQRLRACWLALDELAWVPTGDSKDSYQAREWLVREHQLTLDDLVAIGQLTQPAARQVQVAMAEAALHVSTPYVPFAGQDPTLADSRTGIRAQFAEQVLLLAKGDALSPDAISSAQVRMARYLAFLSLTWRQVTALDESQCRAADGSHRCPSFDQLDLPITPEASSAARFLVEVLTSPG